MVVIKMTQQEDHHGEKNGKSTEMINSYYLH